MLGVTIVVTTAAMRDEKRRASESITAAVKC